MGQKAASYLFNVVSFVIAAVLAVLTLVCRHATGVSPVEGEFWVLAAMALPVLIAVDCVLVLWWLVRRRWVAAVLMAVVIGFGVNEMRSLVRWPGGSSEQPADLKIATLNVHGFRCMGLVPFSSSAIAAVACREGADVVCMQEIVAPEDFPADSIASLFLPQLPYYVQQGSEMIVSRYPIVHSEYKRFENSDNDCMWADLSVNGQPIRVISVHLQTSGISTLQYRYNRTIRSIPTSVLLDEVARNSQIRAGQAEQISRIAAQAEDRVILAGDFNETPSSYIYHLLRSGMTDGFRAAGHGYGGTFRPFGGVLRIDYVFYDEGFEAVRYRTLQEEISDHKMVIAELNFNR